jgi:ABC-type uncharacterized transport system auxiliary subunit
MSRAAWFCTSALLLAACSGELFESKIAPASVYVLRPAQAPPESKMDVDLLIDRPTVRPGLDSARIASEYADRRLNYYANAAWSGDVGDVLLNFAVRSFQQTSGFRSVAAESSRFDAPYRMEMTVNEFVARYASGSDAPVIVIAIAARLGRNGRALAGGDISTRIERPAASNRLGAVIEAYEQASQEAMTEIIVSTRRILAESQDTR